MEIKKVISNYLDRVVLEKKYATFECYESHLRQVLGFCEERKIYDTSDITEDFYSKFLSFQRSRSVCNRTINRRMQYFAAALRNSKITNFEYTKLNVDQKRFSTISEQQLKKIMNYIYKLNEDVPENLTLKLLVMILLDTGVRINECLHIEKDNIELNQRFILLTTTKTSRERIVFFNLYTQTLLKKYLDLDYPGIYLFYNFFKETELTYPAVRYMMKKIKKECSIYKLHPHMFRHTFCTLLYEHNAPIITIKELAGHTDIKTTMNYIHCSVKKNQEDYDKYYFIKN